MKRTLTHLVFSNGLQWEKQEELQTNLAHAFCTLSSLPNWLSDKPKNKL